MEKLCPIPFCTATVFISVKDITWLLNSFRSFRRPWKNLRTTNWYTKFFLVYWVIVYINISSGDIKWHQNSNIFYRFCRWVLWVDIISGLSFDGFGHFLVFLYTIWRTTTKITLKVIVLEQMLTILTYAYCVAIVSTYDEDQRYQRSRKGQQRMEKIQAWKRSENSVTPAVQTSYWCELTLYARHRLSNRPCLIWS